MLWGHLQAAGSQISEGDQSERLIIGGLEGIPSSVFPSQITYGALGHIHREQQIANRNEIRYAGSPLPMSFAEENYRHGVILLEIDKGILLNQTKIIFNPLVTLLRIPKHPAPLDEVLNRPLSSPEERDDHPAPFLEVRVLLTEPEPALRNKVEEALRTKQVRLTRYSPLSGYSTTYKKREYAHHRRITGSLEAVEPSIRKAISKSSARKNWLIYSGKSLKNHS